MMNSTTTAAATIVHSTSNTNNAFKFKWNNFKTWFNNNNHNTAYLGKRRCSECSTTSTITIEEDIIEEDQKLALFLQSSKKRPSITSNIPFRTQKRLENNDCIEKSVKKLSELYDFALDELNYAEDSRGSLYYLGDRLAAKEAIENFENYYINIKSNYPIIESMVQFKLNTLKYKLDSLPLQNDNDDQYSI